MPSFPTKIIKALSISDSIWASVMIYAPMFNHQETYLTPSYLSSVVLHHIQKRINDCFETSCSRKVHECNVDISSAFSSRLIQANKNYAISSFSFGVISTLSILEPV